ncbi:MAG: hypothetical protein DI635_00630 [Pseudoxanthomonas suwonensis]|nr:MAG: hypothetical protein DI635_00630 [Pseudoxanthomonas suwonensis]
MTVTPMKQKALLAFLESDDGYLMRRKIGWAPQHWPTNRQGFTTRLMLKLLRDGLVLFDDPFCPEYAYLTDEGLQAAAELQQDTFPQEAAA